MDQSDSPSVFARRWRFIGFQHHLRGFTKLDDKKHAGHLLSPAFREWGGVDRLDLKSALLFDINILLRVQKILPTT